MSQGRANVSSDAPAPERPTALLRFAPALVVALLLLAGYALGLHRHLTLDALRENGERLTGFVAANPLLSVLAYLGAYVAAVSLSFPGASFLTIAGGFMFGWALGGALAASSATVGATVIFLIARTSIGAMLEEKAGPRLARLGEAFRDNAFASLLVIRLAPVFPFWLVNLAAALFGMKLGPYVAATLLGILPATFAFAWFGENVAKAVATEDATSPGLLFGLALLALVAALPLALKAWRRRHTPAKP